MSENQKKNISTSSEAHGRQTKRQSRNQKKTFTSHQKRTNMKQKATTGGELIIPAKRGNKIVRNNKIQSYRNIRK